MSGDQEITYSLDSWADRREQRKDKRLASQSPLPGGAAVEPAITRVARLMALAIRLEGLLQEDSIRDYAELARLGRVTRARITQIMKLLLLAPEIQEQILFLPPIHGLNERNLRSIVSRIDWDEQRPMFQKIARR